MTENSQLIEKLRSLITDGDEVDRCYAIRTLQTIQDTSSTEWLIKAMRDDDIDVCVDAIEVLGHLGGESVTEKLIESLINDPDGEIKVACVNALAKLCDKKASAELIKLAEKPPEESNYVSDDWDLWWDMQLASVRGLGNMQQLEAIPVLIRILDEDDCLDIESEIFNALAQIGSNKKGHKANEYLFERLSAGTPRTRRRIAKALGKSNATATIKPLARSLQDKDASVREATLLALQKRGATQYLPAVLLTFRDSHSNVRKTAINVAHKLALRLQEKESTDSDLLAKLLPLLQDNDSSVKSAVLDTLTHLNWQADNENKAYLSTLLRECSGDCFASVCHAIDAQQLSDGVATLLYMFRHKELKTAEDEIHALTSIGRSKQWNSVIESTLAAHIFNDEKMVRLTALEALSELDKSFPQGSSLKGLEKDARLPLDMISEALQGHLKPPLTQKVIPIVPLEDVEAKFAVVEEDSAFVDNALEQITQSIADGETPHPLSTLDAIAISSVEKRLEVKQEAPETPLETDDELQDFLALSEKNKEISSWLFNKGAGDVGVDIQCLAARMLGKAGSNTAFAALLKAFEDESSNTKNDNALKREAALSIGILMAKGVRPEESLKPGLNKALLKALNADDRDLRIAAARALASCGVASDIPHLIEKLCDDSTAMRMQTIRSLSKIAMRTDKGIDFHELAKLMLLQLDNNNTGVHRAVVDALVPLFESKLNGSALSLKEATINSLINAGLSGSDGQVIDMSWGLNALDKALSSTRLLEKMDEVSSSIERRYLVEMLGELHRPLLSI